MITTKLKMEKALMLILIAVLLAHQSYAAGLSITEVEARADYDEAYTYSIDNAIERFIKVFIRVKHPPHKNEFAEFFHQCNFQKRVIRFMRQVIGLEYDQ